MCKATTKKGTLCKIAGIYNGFCHIHATDADRKAQRDRRVAKPVLQTKIIPKYNGYQLSGFDGQYIDIDDRQNVHRANINAKLLEATNYLYNTYPCYSHNYKKEYMDYLGRIATIYTIENSEILANPKKEHYSKKIYNFCFFTYTKTLSTPQSYVNTRINNWKKFINILNNNKFYTSQSYLFLATIKHIVSYGHNAKAHLLNLLVNRLVDEVIDGETVCFHGKMARLINIFSGIDGVIGDDNRSTNEKIQDRMAEIYKLDYSLREKTALEFFKDINISQEEKQVWIDALID